MQHSKYQTAAFSWIENEYGHGIINAVAGSGKTYTLIEGMKRVKGKCVFLAFNKSIADELAKKVPAHVEAKTLHSIGLSAVRSHFKRIQIDNQKVDKLMNQVSGLMFEKGMKREEWINTSKKRSMIKKLVSIAKSTLLDIHNNQDLYNVCDHYGIELDTEILPLFRDIFKKSIEHTYFIDFDDMIYYPIIYNLTPWQYDWVMVDECQDLNKAQIELVLSLVKKPNGRIIAVGDPKQSIYGFRGADTEAMSRIQNALQAKELPLSICYRCPKEHIDLVKDIVPQIEATEKSGIINNIKTEIFLDTIIKEINDNPLVLCRTNAPLVEYALELISHGYKATIKGRDIGSGLISILNSFQSVNAEDIYNEIDSWESKEIDNLYKRHAAESVIKTVEDKAQTLKLLTDNCKTKFDIINKIEKLFTDDKTNGVELSTVHKAKGLEAHSVYIIYPELLPLSFKNQKPWEIEQELNIKYVALTRSKYSLTFVNN
jgi:superfamily I DNA/RNA helicase